MTVISQASGKEMPVLEVKKEAEVDSTRGISLWDGGAAGGTGDAGPYGDLETKGFYEVYLYRFTIAGSDKFFSFLKIISKYYA